MKPLSRYCQTPSGRWAAASDLPSCLRTAGTSSARGGGSCLLSAHAARDVALTSGFHRALLAASIFVAAAAVIALRTVNTRGEITAEPSAGPDRGEATGAERAGSGPVQASLPTGIRAAAGQAPQEACGQRYLGEKR